MYEVSVIIPVHNGEKYIGRCIDSLIKQEFSNWELIVIDDGSTDNTVKICQTYSSLDFRIKIYSQVNQGVSAARNHGLQLAQGKYIAFVDADDWVSNDYLETLVHILKNNNAELSVAGYIEVRNLVEFESRNVDEKTTIQRMQGNDLLNSLYNTTQSGYLWNKLFVTNIIKENNLTFEKEITVWEDMLFCFRYMLKIKSMVVTNRVVYAYFQNSDSVMHEKNYKKEYTKVNVLRILCNYKNNKPFQINSKRYLIRFWVNYFYEFKAKKTKKIMQECINDITNYHLWENMTYREKIKLLFVILQIKLKIYCCL